jgi:hypothetical protein
MASPISTRIASVVLQPLKQPPFFSTITRIGSAGPCELPSVQFLGAVGHELLGRAPALKADNARSGGKCHSQRLKRACRKRR